MNQRPALLAGCMLLLGYVGPETAGAQTRTRLEAEAQYTERGTEQCLTCHAGDAMTIMAETPHGNLDNPHTPYSQHGCESCHGPGSVHVSRAGGGVGFPPLLSFKNADDVPQRNAACTNCHAQDLGEQKGIAWAGSLHDEAGMSCQVCHQSHSSENPMADRALQQESCGRCHGSAVEKHRESGFPLDAAACSSCHAVHELQAK